MHRWDTLRMSTVNGIFALPGMPVPTIDPDESSNTAVPRYFGSYEAEQRLPILRPRTVQDVVSLSDSPGAPLRVTTDKETWQVEAIINATGTWDNPVTPDFPGRASFLGRQLHTRDYAQASEFAGQRVAVVGGGISAVQILEEISRTAETFWYTRRRPVFLEHEFAHEREGVDVERRVGSDAAKGIPPRSVVSYTGLGWTSYAVAARERGVLDPRPMFTAVSAHHLSEADGTSTAVDAIVWATGFRPSLAHLAHLDLYGPLGGIPVVGTQAARDPRIHLIGYGPSQSTIGANRAGRAAAVALTTPT